MKGETRQSETEEHFFKERRKGRKKGVDNFANACQSVCSTWPPSTTLSFIHTLPVKTDSLYNGHMSNSSLTAAREDTVCICQEMNKHLQLSQQKKRSKNTENSDTSVTWVMTWTLDSLSRRNSNIWLAVLFLLTCNLLIYSFYILYLIF